MRPQVSGRQVAVVGMARSGVAAAEWLLAHGARVTALDRRDAAELPPAVRALSDRGARLELGEHNAETLRAADLVVLSPGVPWDLPAVAAARDAGVPVMAELELAARVLSGRVAAITGTKGKSTTTAALGAMLREQGGDVRVGGNIGTAAISLVDGSTPDTTFVLEVSSFQLEGTQELRPALAAFTNLSPDHLDRHPSFDAYAEAKGRIFANQTADDWAVVNGADDAVLGLAARGRARRIPVFGTAPAPGEGAYFQDGQAILRRDGLEDELFAVKDVLLPGAHLAFDLLMAATSAALLGAPPLAIARAVRSYRGVEHVLELVAEQDDVRWFNDSKATNVDSARRSVEAFAGPLLVIMGGRFKGGDLRALRPALGRVRTVLAIGEARPLLEDALSDLVTVQPCDSLGDAVDRARASARPGDTVLLAPACASFDMFADYAARGRAFKDEVARVTAPRVPEGAA